MIKLCMTILLAEYVFGSLPKLEIIHGKNVGWMKNNQVHNPRRFRYTARLQCVYDLEDENGTIKITSGNCGASIIRPDVVITAAHCLTGRNVRNITVEAGIVNTVKKQDSSQKMQITDFVIHKDFALSPFVANDIALIFLPEPFKLTGFVKTISLAKQGTYEGLKLTTVGWGRNEQDKLPEWLQYAHLNIVEHRKCQNVSSNFISSNMLCAKDVEGRSIICRGDSGGPLVWKNRLVGIASWVVKRKVLPSGGESCDANFPAVFVDVYKYSNWIKDTIRNYRVERYMKSLNVTTNV